MIDVKMAVGLAQKYIRELYADEKITGLSLEEVELTGDEKCWLVTLSFYAISRGGLGVIAGIVAPGQSVQKFKIVKLDATTGQVKSMKIRTV